MAMMGPKKKGFDWGRAAIGFFGGAPAVQSLQRQDAMELEEAMATAKAQAATEARQSAYEAALQRTGDPVIARAMANDPATVSSFLKGEFQTFQTAPDTSLARRDASGKIVTDYTAPSAPTTMEKESRFLDSANPALGEAYRTKQAVTTVQGVDPATGQTIVQALDPRQLFGGGGMAAPMGTPGFNPNAAPLPATGGLPAGWRLEDEGGAAPQASRPFDGASGGGRLPDPLRAPGRLTSGRRTPEGNRAVGGVANSYHLSGDAADYVGTTPAALRSYYGSGVKIIDEGDHLHVQGRGLNAPYYGKRGTMGLWRRR